MISGVMKFTDIVKVKRSKERHVYQKEVPSGRNHDGLGTVDQLLEGYMANAAEKSKGEETLAVL